MILFSDRTRFIRARPDGKGLVFSVSAAVLDRAGWKEGEFIYEAAVKPGKVVLYSPQVEITGEIIQGPYFSPRPPGRRSFPVSSRILRLAGFKVEQPVALTLQKEGPTIIISPR